MNSKVFTILPDPISVYTHFSLAPLAFFLSLEHARRSPTIGLHNSAIPLLEILFAQIFMDNSLTFFGLGLNVMFSFNKHLGLKGGEEKSVLGFKAS